MRVAFVGCSSTKLPGVHPAARKYDGDYYTKRLTAAYQQYEEVMIISAKYGFLSPEMPIDDYDCYLGRDKSVSELRDELLAQRHRLPEGDDAVILAGKKYLDAARPALEAEGYRVHGLFQDLGHSGIGDQIGWLTTQMGNIHRTGFMHD